MRLRATSVSWRLAGDTTMRSSGTPALLDSLPASPVCGVPCSFLLFHLALFHRSRVVQFKVAVQYQALAHERARLRQRDELSGALAHPHKTVSPHRADSPATAAATADASVADMDETAMAGVGRSDGAIAESLFAVSAPMQCEDDGAAATARSPARSRTVPAHALSVLDTPPRERDVAVLAALHTPPLALPPGHAAAVVAPVDVVDETLPTPPPPPSGARAPPAASSQSR